MQCLEPLLGPSALSNKKITNFLYRKQTYIFWVRIWVWKICICPAWQKKTINQKLTYVSIVTRTFKTYYCVSMPTFLAIVNIAILGNMIFFWWRKKTSLAYSVLFYLTDIDMISKCILKLIFKLSTEQESHFNAIVENHKLKDICTVTLEISSTLKVPRKFYINLWSLNSRSRLK